MAEDKRMFCTTCGQEVASGNRYCAQCGTPVGPGARRSPSNPPLVRIRSEKKIGGVCAGFAHYLSMDVTLLRILTLVIAITTGVGFIAYIVAWIVMPIQDMPPVVAGTVPAQPPEPAR